MPVRVQVPRPAPPENHNGGKEILKEEMVERSSKGRTRDSGSRSGGSNPPLSARFSVNLKELQVSPSFSVTFAFFLFT